MPQRPAFGPDETLHEIELDKIQDSDIRRTERLQEFMNRPATPPPFPENLPSRPLKQKSWWKTNKLLLFALIFGVVIALGGVVALTVLYRLEKVKAIEASQHEEALQSELAQMQMEPSISTATSTSISTKFVTQQMWSTIRETRSLMVTLTTTQKEVRTEVFTWTTTEWVTLSTVCVTVPASPGPVVTSTVDAE